MKRNFGRLGLCILAATATLLLAPAPSIGAEKPEKKEKKEKSHEGEQPSIWMKKKLDYSQNILAGISTANFDKIADNARAMQGMSRFEGFVRAKNPGYRTQLQIFQDANEEIIRQADEDNVEGVALAFTQLTISCVNCHKQIRRQEKK